MPQDSIISKTLLGGLYIGLGFFGAIRTGLVPFAVANPALRGTRGEDLLYAATFVGAFSLNGMALAYEYYTDTDPNSARRQLENADWYLRGIFTGVTSALVIFGLMQAAQAILLYFATGLSTTPRNDLIQLIAVMGLVCLLGSTFAANYYRRQSQQQGIDVQPFNPAENVANYSRIL
jgi:sterol desaturase/sphingolipid hydroxylase (fatty acid hydroxylase superfamily)